MGGRRLAVLRAVEVRDDLAAKAGLQPSLVSPVDRRAPVGGDAAVARLSCNAEAYQARNAPRKVQVCPPAPPAQPPPPRPDPSLAAF